MRFFVILFLLLLALPAFAGTLRDDFSDGNFDGWSETWMNQNQTTWKVESGVLIGDNPSNWSAFLVVGDPTWKDYEITCDARLVTVRNTIPTFGIGIRHNKQVGAAFKTFWFGLNLMPNQFLPMGAGIVYLSEAHRLVKVTKEMPVEIGKWYRLMVNFSKDHLEGFVDGKKVVDIIDNSLVSGAVGLEAHSCIAQYDNIIIKGDDVPDLNLHVQPLGKLPVYWSQIRRLMK